MSWLDRFNRRLNLSDGTSLKKPATSSFGEVGVVGQSIIGGFDDTEQRADKMTVADYVKMRQNDGTISSLYNLLTLIPMSTQYSIDADEADTNEEQADFVRQVLLAPPHKGGMEVPMPIVLADMSRAVLEGFRVFNKVYAIKDGRVVYRKLAPRDADTIHLIRSDDGGYGGAHQRTTFKGKYIDVVMKPSETFLFTYGKDKNFLYGESAFKAASYHYQEVRKLYYLANLSVQTGAVPPKVLTGPSDLDKGKRNTATADVAKLGGVRTVAYVPDTMTLTPYDSSKGRVDALPLIEHHKAEEARSVLAQFIMLGTSGASGKSGSFALSKDHSDILLTALKSFLQSIEDHINYYLIPDLIDLNFAQPAYPQWHFEDITSDTKDLVQTAFTQIITSGAIGEALKQGIEDRVAESLDIDVDQIQKQLDKEAKKKIAEAQKSGVAVDAKGDPLPPAPQPPQPPDSKPPVNQSDKAADDDPKGSTSPTLDLARRQKSESILQRLRNDLTP